MHGRTYKALKVGRVVTVWGDGVYAGECGIVVSVKPPRGIVIHLDSGNQTTQDCRDVAMGDNSRIKNEE